VKNLKQRKKKQTLAMIVGEQRKQLRLTRQREAEARAEEARLAREKADAMVIAKRREAKVFEEEKKKMLAITVPRFVRAKNLWEMMLTEMSERHDWFSIVFVYSAVYSRPFRIALIVSATMVLMFLNAVLYYLSYPQGKCEEATRKRQCLEQTYWYNRTKSMCRWSSHEQTCYYVEPESANYVLTVVIAVMSNIISLPFNSLLATILNNLILPPVMSRALIQQKDYERKQKKLAARQAKVMRAQQEGQSLSGWRQSLSLLSPTYVQGHFGDPTIPPGVQTASQQPAMIVPPVGSRAQPVDPSREMARKNIYKRFIVRLLMTLILAPLKLILSPLWRRWKKWRRKSKQRRIRASNRAAAFDSDDEDDKGHVVIPSPAEGGTGTRLKIDSQLLKFKQAQQFRRFVEAEALKMLYKAQEQRRELVDHIDELRKAQENIQAKLRGKEQGTSNGNQEEIGRWRSQNDFIEQRLKELVTFQRKFEKLWFLDKNGLPRKVTWWEEIWGQDFYVKLRKRVQGEIEMARQVEKMLLAMPPEDRELRLLEYQRLDFMSPPERKMYIRNQIDYTREMPPDPIRPWKKCLGWLVIILLNLFFGFFVLLFGIKHGAKTANSWLLSFVGGTIQDPLLNMPLLIMYWNVFTPWFIKGKITEDLQSANDEPFIFSTFIPTGPACR